MKLFQIPFSHNSVKVRKVLALKGLDYERENVNPAYRRKLKRISGQELTPVLVDGERVVADSTAIALYLEQSHPTPSLLPEDPDQRAECLLLEDWADSAFMALSRRLAYWALLQSDVSLGDLFFPQLPQPIRRTSGSIGGLILRRRFGLTEKQAKADEAEARRVARLALDRIAARPFLVGERISLADVAFASMSAPFQFAPQAVRDDQAVRGLLAWDQTILEDEFTPPQVRRTAAPA